MGGWMTEPERHPQLYGHPGGTSTIQHHKCIVKANKGGVNHENTAIRPSRRRLAASERLLNTIASYLEHPWPSQLTVFDKPRQISRVHLTPRVL
jgi:hypothetical protein